MAITVKPPEHAFSVPRGFPSWSGAHRYVGIVHSPILCRGNPVVCRLHLILLTFI